MNLRKRVNRTEPVTNKKTSVTKKKPKTEKAQTKKKKYVSNSFDSSSGDNSQYMEVEKILDKKTWGGKVHYLIKWAHYKSYEATWENEEHMRCPDLIQEYEERVRREEEEKVRLKAEWEEKKARQKAEREAQRDQRKIEREAEKAREKEKARIKAEKNRLQEEKRKMRKEEKAARMKNSQESQSVPPCSQENNLNNAKENNLNNSNVENVYHKKSARIKDADINERMKRIYNDSYEKPIQVKNVKLNRKEVSKEKHNDSRARCRVENVETSEHEIVKKRHDEFGTKHTMKNVELNGQEIIKKRRDGLSRKKPEVVLSNSKHRQIPNIQNLQYYVKSSNFPKKRKNGMMSVMRVSFQGTDVLKGLERFVEAGIATGPLPDFLYEKPKKTGATEFQFTV